MSKNKIYDFVPRINTQELLSDGSNHQQVSGPGINEDSLYIGIGAH